MSRGVLRITVISVVTVVLTVTIFLIIDHLTSPVLYAEDELQRKDCVQCAGTGIDERWAKDYPKMGHHCPACAGSGEVDVVLPGPHRPTRLQGIVVDGTQLGPRDTFDGIRERYSPFRPESTGFRRAKAAISRAELTFVHEDGKEYRRQCNLFGIFTVELIPGSYTVTVEADGFKELTTSFNVPRLTEPIYLERVKTRREPRTLAEARSLYGLEAFVTLTRDDEHMARFLIRPGRP